MQLTSTPAPLVCAECGDPLEEGYLPALDHGAEYEPAPEGAVCTACGFNEVGYAGCAPEVDDLSETDDDAVLLHVGVSGGDVDVRSAKE